ncbi:uncharacterized protein RJT21DRAFT_123130 [Scheffersomyces amazonensis]|uniref:uncharacterized protein n=1 Tax=Scheffersomyces amazonensis TaxID=1078765 RepID=UPI00315CC139
MPEFPSRLHILTLYGQCGRGVLLCGVMLGTGVSPITAAWVQTSSYLQIHMSNEMSSNFTRCLSCFMHSNVKIPFCTSIVNSRHYLLSPALISLNSI